MLLYFKNFILNCIYLSHLYQLVLRVCELAAKVRLMEGWRLSLTPSPSPDHAVNAAQAHTIPTRRLHERGVNSLIPIVRLFRIALAILERVVVVMFNGCVWLVQ